MACADDCIATGPAKTSHMDPSATVTACDLLDMKGSSMRSIPVSNQRQAFLDASQAAAAAPNPLGHLMMNSFSAAPSKATCDNGTDAATHNLMPPSNKLGVADVLFPSLKFCSQPPYANMVHAAHITHTWPLTSGMCLKTTALYHPSSVTTVGCACIQTQNVSLTRLGRRRFRDAEYDARSRR